MCRNFWSMCCNVLTMSAFHNSHHGNRSVCLQKLLWFQVHEIVLKGRSKGNWTWYIIRRTMPVVPIHLLLLSYSYVTSTFFYHLPNFEMTLLSLYCPIKLQWFSCVIIGADSLIIINRTIKGALVNMTKTNQTQENCVCGKTWNALNMYERKGRWIVLLPGPRRYIKSFKS